jgi:hypothetical protein
MIHAIAIGSYKWDETVRNIRVARTDSEHELKLYTIDVMAIKNLCLCTILK